MARTGKPFTAEDVVNEIGAPGGSGKVIGAAFNTVARSGMIWRCGERPADRKTSHRRMLAVWRGGQVQEQVRLFDEWIKGYALHMWRMVLHRQALWVLPEME